MVTTTTAQQTQRTLTLSELISRFVSRRNLSPSTQNFYAILLGNFEWYTQNNEWPPPETVTRSHVQEFLNYVSSEKYRWPEAGRSSFKKASMSTVHHYGMTVKSLFNWAEAEGYLQNNPSRFIKLGSPGYKDVEPYSDDEVMSMLSVCEQDARFGYRYLGIRNKAIIFLFVATGLRIEEMSTISLDDFDPRLSEIRVMGKGSKPRVVPVNGEAKRALGSYLRIRPDSGRELWLTSSGAAMAKKAIEVMIVRLKRRAGVESSGGAHRLRHYFATRYLEAGGDLNSLRLLLGHSTLHMVLRYSKFVDIRKAVASHHQFCPLDRLLRGNNNHNRGGDSWGWRQ